MKKSMVKVCVAFILVSLMAFISGCSNEEKENAISEFDAERNRINAEISTLQGIITECEDLLDTGATPYDLETLTALENETTKAREAIQELPKQPNSTEEIIAATDSLKTASYTSQIDDLNSTKKEYITSVKIMEQITNPSEAFVIGCLEQISGITGYEAVTEDNDPNGQLHKQGGYTSAVFFSYEKVDQDDTYGETIIDKGTDAGGQIEVYETVELAQKRDDYLSTFDGTVFASGSHTVLGTMVLRTSALMNATDQKELETALIKEFTTLDSSE